MGRERKGKVDRKLMSEPNMTPLMDLTFLLLIAFIITFPMLEQGISIRLPRGKTEQLDQNKSHTITVALGDEVYLDNHRVGHAELEVRLRDLAGLDPQPPILVRCDERVEYGALVKTLRILNSCRISRMALVTNPSD